MIRAALFDFGGVVLSSPFEAFARYEADQGLPPGFLRGLNATNPDTNAWARLERSEVLFEEFCLLFEGEAAQAGGSIDARQVMALLAGELRPAMVQAVKRCRERLKTACLTNNFVTGPGSRRIGMDEMFDAVIESSRVGVRKPDPRFYTMACELLEIEPTEAVFLDDLGVNLKPAREMGMTTIKVEDPDVAIEALEEVVGFSLR
ncbi:MAG TPA: HAD-IA family hydrolase [Acidimicrobiales bacterium]|nr:HAD-IA family hydrolase [Acidimicrobiales bacterium]